MGQLRTERSFCRICSGSCGVVLEIEDDRLTGIRGDHEHLMTRGYACVKGLQAPDMLGGPGRLTKALRRTASGSHEEVSTEHALDEIAERTGGIISAHGARAVGAWRGTNPWFQTLSHYAVPAFVSAIGSDQFYSSMTIDQSAKWVAMERLGVWAAGKNRLETSDVWMMIGNNPLVSVSGLSLSFNPQKKIRELKARGLRFIVVDPRRTETAQHADIFLQLRPGEDVTLAAGLLHIILAEGLEDTEFCARHVDNLEGFRAALAPFTPDYVAERAGVPQDTLIEAARAFAAGPRGCTQTGTGPDMGPRSNLAEHLYECLNVICGRFPREGEKVANPGIMLGQRPWLAQVVPPRRRWERGPSSRVRQIGMMLGEMMAGVLPEEILDAGEDRLRALFVVGGNPASSMPDQRRAVEALRALDLLVSIDPTFNETARLSDYVLPARLLYEVPGVPVLQTEPYFFPEPFAQYAPAHVAAPAETMDDWRYLWEICRRLGVTYAIDRQPLSMDEPPSSEEVMRLLLRKSQVPFEDLAATPGGACFSIPEQVVEAGASDARFAVAPQDVVDELREVAAENWQRGPGVSGDYPFRLTARRIRESYNGQYRDLPRIRARIRTNPLWMNPADIARLGLADGLQVRVVSELAAIPAILEADETMRPGAVSMTHGFGGLPDEALDPAEHGSNISLLIDGRAGSESINAMPRMSAIPVRIEAIPGVGK